MKATWTLYWYLLATGDTYGAEAVLDELTPTLQPAEAVALAD